MVTNTTELWYGLSMFTLLAVAYFYLDYHIAADLDPNSETMRKRFGRKPRK